MSPPALHTHEAVQLGMKTTGIEPSQRVNFKTIRYNSNLQPGKVITEQEPSLSSFPAEELPFSGVEGRDT